MIGRALYAFLFCVALPALLLAWALRLDALGIAPALAARPELGIALATTGLLLWLWSVIALRHIGGGLPMNAFPPPRFVASGPYALVAHPIYLGAATVVAGTALATGSGGGWWIVAPALLLASFTLALGHEEPDLDRRFGAGRARPLTAPRCGAEPPSLRDGLCVWFGLYLPFLIGYEWIGHLPVHDPIDLMARESAWPVWTPTALLYSSVYPVAVAAPFFASSRDALRRWTLDARFGVALGFLLFLTLPFVATPRAFDADAPFAWLLALERGDGVGARAAFPSFHVFWAFFCAVLLAERWPRARIALFGWAILVALSCSTTGMHALVDLGAGALLAWIARRRTTLWTSALAIAERIANGWREWRIGPIRIINHGLFAGLAAAVGVAVIGACAGDAGAGSIAIVAIASLVGAALWGQYWVGSATLLRPFGYFGSVLGIALALVVLAWAGWAGWPLAAAIAVAAPWAQAIGRLRCLVQGCCHGAPIATGGIVYRHPRSRVVALSKLGGVEVHATPLYSLLANAVLGSLLLRLAFVGARASFLFGAYLVLAGCIRFVEESRRGEPHTPVRGGLRLYQWCAIGLVVAGAAVTAIESPAVAPPAWPGWTTLALALAVGAAHVVAMGVDWPDGRRRFSRLL